MDEINQIERAALAWQVLINIAEERDVIRYKALGNEIGIHHRAVKFVLAVIQNYCLEHELPPITILVGDADGLPGAGFIAWDVDNFEEGFRIVYDYNWKNLDNPFNYALEGQTEEEIVEELLSQPDESGSVYSKVKVRGTAQTIFRLALLKAYNSKCAFCGLSFPPALQAAHIIPWAKSNHQQRLDVRNGLLLCASHHCLYDAGILNVDPEYKIKFNQRFNTRKLSDCDKFLTLNLNDKRINLPTKAQHRPIPEYIISRNSAIA